MEWFCEGYPLPLILDSMAKEESRAYYNRGDAFPQENNIEITGARGNLCRYVLHYICDYGLEI